MLLATFTLMLVRDAKETTRRELRAYIKFTGAPRRGSNVRILAGERPITTINIENVGKTPAREVVVRLAIAVTNFPLSAALPNEIIDANTSRAVVFPGDRFNYSATRADVLTAVEIASIRRTDSDIRMYIYGRVDYTDIFGDDRWTTFRVLSTFIGGNLGFTLGAEGNDAS